MAEVSPANFNFSQDVNLASLSHKADSITFKNKLKGTENRSCFISYSSENLQPLNMVQNLQDTVGNCHSHPSQNSSKRPTSASNQAEQDTAANYSTRNSTTSEAATLSIKDHQNATDTAAVPIQNRNPGAYVQETLKLIDEKEILVPMPNDMWDLFFSLILREFNSMPKCNRECDTHHGEIYPVAVSSSEQQDTISRYFLCVWTPKRHLGCIMKRLRQCDLKGFHSTCKVEFVITPNVSSKRKWLRYTLFRSMERVSDTAGQEDMPRTDEEVELSCGLQLFGFRNGIVHCQITLGGFIIINNVPFIVSAGHFNERYKYERETCQEEASDKEEDMLRNFHDLGPHDIGLQNGDLEFEEWDPENDDDSEKLSNYNDPAEKLIEDSQDYHHDKWPEVPPNGNEDKQSLTLEQVVFRLNNNINSKIVGVECYLPNYLDGSRRDPIFLNDWCLILPSPDCKIRGNIWFKSESNNKPMTVYEHETLCTDELVRILGPSTHLTENLGRISALTTIKLPGSASFAEARTVNLQQSVKYGNSGSWIVNSENRWIGQLGAGRCGTKTGYFIPAEYIVESIRRTFFPLKVDLFRASPGAESAQAEHEALFKKASDEISFLLSAESMTSILSPLKRPVYDGSDLVSRGALPSGPFLDASRMLINENKPVCCPACRSCHTNQSSLHRCMAKYLKPFVCVICETNASYRMHHFGRIDDTLKHILFRHYPEGKRSDLVDGVHFRVMTGTELRAISDAFFAYNTDYTT